MITGKKAINFKLGAFNFGADDYLCKPFNLLELKARIRALIKRTKKYKSQKHFKKIISRSSLNRNERAL